DGKGDRRRRGGGLWDDPPTGGAGDPSLRFRERALLAPPAMARGGPGRTGRDGWRRRDRRHDHGDGRRPRHGADPRPTANADHGSGHGWFASGPAVRDGGGAAGRDTSALGGGGPRAEPAARGGSDSCSASRTG